MKFKSGDILEQKYKIIKKIGSGSFGTIYMVEHLISKKFLAVKIEPTNVQYPLILYEANVTLLIHGIRQSQ